MNVNRWRLLIATWLMAMEPSVASFSRSALWQKSAWICPFGSCPSCLYSFPTDTLPINPLARICFCCLPQGLWLLHTGIYVHGENDAWERENESFHWEIFGISWMKNELHLKGLFEQSHPRSKRGKEMRTEFCQTSHWNEGNSDCMSCVPRKSIPI